MKHCMFIMVYKEKDAARECFWGPGSQGLVYHNTTLELVKKKQKQKNPQFCNFILHSVLWVKMDHILWRNDRNTDRGQLGQGQTLHYQGVRMY